MAGNDKDLLDRLLATFRVEAEEHARTLSTGLLRLEKQPPADERAELVEVVFRSAHSLKGAARAVRMTQIEVLCQSLESVFVELKRQHLTLSASLFDQLHRAVDLVEALAAAGSEAPDVLQRQVASVTRSLERALPRGRLAGPVKRLDVPPPAQMRPVEPPTTAKAVPGTSTVRVFTSKLDRIMRDVEGLLAPRLAAEQRAEDLRAAMQDVMAWRKRSAGIDGVVRRLDRALETFPAQQQEGFRKVLDYVADEQVRLRALEDRLGRIGGAADLDRRQLAMLTDGLQHRVKEIQVQPWSGLLELFAREARDIARTQGKEVDLQISGGAIESDRRLLDEMRDPLIHLVRNCIDHGIETPANRRAVPKPVRGSIRLSVAQNDSGKVTLVVADDGAGIDIHKLKESATASGLANPADIAALDDAAALQLVFQSGLSTRSAVTDVSGRGLGLAIVRERIEQFGGDIQVSSERGRGTRFTITLPTMLSTFRGTLVVAAGTHAVIPSANIDHIIAVRAGHLNEATRHATVMIEGQPVPCVRLADALGSPPVGRKPSAPSYAVVLGRGATRVAFGVDEIVDEQEVLVKPLGPLLRRVRNIAGATVLGDGRIVAVMNVSDLLATAARHPAEVAVVSAPEQESEVQRSVLVVEDSITSRALMKSILEGAGYQVTTAVDGIDAFTALKTAPFDVVVTDVDMPRMDGIDLTLKVRADKQLADLPVILVTTMHSREDRERGVDAGASAYIVKSSFDQSNLLEVIRRLV